jgi:hypothetical protein
MNFFQTSLVEPILVRVVVRFAWLRKAVVERLVFWGPRGGYQETVAFLRQRQKPATRGFLMADFSFDNQALLADVREVRLHVPLISAIYKLFEMFCGHGPKFADIRHRLNVRAAEHVDTAAMFIWLPRLNDPDACEGVPIDPESKETGSMPGIRHHSGRALVK